MAQLNQAPYKDIGIARPLSSYTKAQLKRYCERFNVRKGGRKDQIIDRLRPRMDDALNAHRRIIAERMGALDMTSILILLGRVRRDGIDVSLQTERALLAEQVGAKLLVEMALNQNRDLMHMFHFSYNSFRRLGDFARKIRDGEINVREMQQQPLIDNQAMNQQQNDVPVEPQQVDLQQQQLNDPQQPVQPNNNPPPPVVIQQQQQCQDLLFQYEGRLCNKILLIPGQEWVQTQYIRNRPVTTTLSKIVKISGYRSVANGETAKIALIRMLKLLISTTSLVGTKTSPPADAQLREDGNEMDVDGADENDEENEDEKKQEDESASENRLRVQRGGHKSYIIIRKDPSLIYQSADDAKRREIKKFCDERKIDLESIILNHFGQESLNRAVELGLVERYEPPQQEIGDEDEASLALLDAL